MKPNELDAVTLEQRVRERVDAIGLALMQEVFERADASEPELLINGELWGNHQRVHATYQTMFGSFEMMRGTYQRSGRGRVAVPMELRLSIAEGRYTPQLARVMTRAVGLMTSEEAEGFLEEVGTAKVSVSTLHRVPRAIAARFEERRMEIEPAVRSNDPVPAEAVTVQVSLDGVMVPQDGEHAKPRGRKTKSPDPPRHEQRYKSKPVSTPASSDGGSGREWHEAGVATLAYYDEEGERLKTTYLGQMPEPLKATLARGMRDELIAAIRERPDLDVVFASDGAPHHWTVLAALEGELKRLRHRGRVLFLVDFFHVAEYLQAGAEAIAGEATPEARLIARGWGDTLRLFDDGAVRVLKSMRYYRRKLEYGPRMKLDKALDYLATQNNANRARFAEAEKRNYPIGTGVTEAAAKTLVSVRMKRAGARYSQHGGQTILLFRSAVLSGRFHLLARRLEATHAANVVIPRKVA